MATKHFPRPFRWVHWITALIILVMLLGGQQFGGEMAEADRQFSLKMHASLGALVVLLVLFRLTCRFSGYATPPDHGLPTAQKHLARLVQWSIYALLIALPISGMLSARAHELPVLLFGFIDISTPDQARFEVARQLHEYITWALMGLLVLHIGAGLLHAFKRDGVLAAMNPLQRKG